MASMSEDAEEELPAPEKKKGKLAMRSVIVLIVGTLVGSGVGVGVVGPLLSSTLGGEVQPGEVDGEAEHAEEEIAPEDLVVYTLDNLIANPAGSNGARFVMFSVGIEVEGDEESAEEEVGHHDAELRDRLLALVGTKTVEELSEVDARRWLKGEILEVVADVLSEMTVYHIYLPEYVIS